MEHSSPISQFNLPFCVPHLANLFKTTQKIELVSFFQTFFFFFLIFSFSTKNWKCLWTSFWHYFLASLWWTTKASGNSGVVPLPIQNFILFKDLVIVKLVSGFVVSKFFYEFNFSLNNSQEMKKKKTIEWLNCILLAWLH